MERQIPVMGPGRVIVEVSGGLVQVVHVPEGIEAVVVDHDELSDETTPPERVREVVAESPELPWGKEGYSYRDEMRPGAAASRLKEKPGRGRGL